MKENITNSEIKFLANTTNCYTENGVFIIGISDDPISPNHYLILSRYDEDDVDESIGIQTHLTGMEVAKAIKRIVLKANILTIEINKHNTEQVRAKKMIIECSEIDKTLLITYINNIFLNSSVKVIISG